MTVILAHHDYQVHIQNSDSCRQHSQHSIRHMYSVGFIHVEFRQMPSLNGCCRIKVNLFWCYKGNIIMLDDHLEKKTTCLQFLGSQFWIRPWCTLAQYRGRTVLPLCISQMPSSGSMSISSADLSSEIQFDVLLIHESQEPLPASSSEPRQLGRI